MSFNISCTVILYNPVSEFINNIKTYINLVDHIFIIDNSDNPNNYIKDLEFRNPKIEYISNSSNLGIASALNIAAYKSIKKGYKFILTMDQDSYFEDGSLKRLIHCVDETKHETIGIYSPFHKNKFFTKPPKNNNIVEVSDVMTSGNILNLSIFKELGKFKEDYFIDYVDIEYCLRLRKNGYKVVRVNDSFLVHNEADLTRRKFFALFVYPQNHSTLRWYYKIRNFYYMKDEYGSLFKDYFDKERKNIRNSVLKVFLFEKNKIKKVKMMVKGYIHFKKNIKGKVI